MSRSRSLVKKVVFRIFGETTYQKVYVRGKISDIHAGKNLEEEAQFLHHFIAADSTVIDIGANYGHYTVELAKFVYLGKVYAFEPVPFTFGVLEKIVRHFELKNVTLFHAAVSDKAGSVLMTIPLLDFGAPNTGVAHVGETAAKNSKTVSVKTLKLDGLEINGRVDFIKIDIEGHEPMAFEGMNHLIQKHQPVILMEFSHHCLNRAGFVPADFAALLASRWNYCFTQKNGEMLELIPSKDLPDGYYFLIPEIKMNQFKSLIHV